jgi:HSP20 family protein
MPTNKVTAEAATATAEVMELPRMDEAIAGVEQLYEALTGSPPPPPAEEASPIPVEKDAAEFVTERLDRLIEALGQPVSRTQEAAWSPPITVWEDGEEMLISLEVPGVARQDLQVFDDGLGLTVSGRRPALHDGMRLRLTERPLGPFRRRILLPRGTGGGEMNARLRDGVLEIRVPRSKAAQSAGGRAVHVA